LILDLVGGIRLNGDRQPTRHTHDTTAASATQRQFRAMISTVGPFLTHDF
jgi:hypothetical protein